MSSFKNLNVYFLNAPYKNVLVIWSKIRSFFNKPRFGLILELQAANYIPSILFSFIAAHLLMQLETMKAEVQKLKSEKLELIRQNVVSIDISLSLYICYWSYNNE